MDSPTHIASIKNCPYNPKNMKVSGIKKNKFSNSLVNWEKSGSTA